MQNAECSSKIEPAIDDPLVYKACDTYGKYIYIIDTAGGAVGADMHICEVVVHGKTSKSKYCFITPSFQLLDKKQKQSYKYPTTPTYISIL